MRTTAKIVYKEGGQYDFPVMPWPKAGDVVTAADGNRYKVVELSNESVHDLDREPNMLVLLQDGGWVKCMKAFWLRHRLSMLEQQKGPLIFVPHNQGESQ